MDSRLFGVMVFVIFLILIAFVSFVVFVPIKNEGACVRYCEASGFKGGFCVKVQIFSEEIGKIETQENANFTEGQCLWNPISLDMETTFRCFCKN